MAHPAWRGHALFHVALALLGSVGCEPALGPDPFPVDAASPLDVGSHDAPSWIDAPGHDGGPVGPRPALDPGYFFCRVQPVVLSAHRCASQDNDCHADSTGYRLDVSAESIAPPTCVDDRPVGAIPAAYYTNLARSRGEVRAAATSSDLYTRPIGRDHPVRLFDASSAEANILVQWIEGAR